MNNNKSFNTDKHYSLTLNQKRIWFLQALDPGASGFVHTFAFELVSGKNLSRKAVEEAARSLFKNNQPLRGVVTLVANKTPRQYFLAAETDCRPVYFDESPSVFIDGLSEKPFDVMSGGGADFFYTITDSNVLTLVIRVHAVFVNRLMLPLLAQDFERILKGGKVSEDSSLSDFIEYQYQFMSSESATENTLYWKNKLAEPRTELDLPADRPRPQMKNHSGKMIRRSLSPEFSEKIAACAAENSMTSFQLVFCLVSVLFYRYTGNSEITAGAEMLFPGAPEGKAGIFLNSIPVSLKINPESDIRTFLKHALAEFKVSGKNRDIPLSEIIENSNHTNNTSRNPLFDFVVSEKIFGIPHDSLSICDTERFHSDYDLEIAVDCSGIISLEVVYDNALFDEQRMESLISHLEVLIASVLSNPEAGIADADILTEKEKQFLIKCNSTEHPFPDTETLASAFEEQVSKTPDAAALIIGDRTISYSGLEKLSRAAARTVSKDSSRNFTGIMAERSLEMIAGIYGIIRSGRAYIPLNPDYPAQRTEWMLEDTGFPAVLTFKKYADKLKGQNCRMFFFEDSADSGGSEPDIRPEDSAYVIFTSGSTGRPKGVEISHKAIMNRLYWMQETFPLNENDIILQKTPYSFDVSVWEIFWWSRCGASLAVLPPGAERNPEEITEFIADKGCTVMHFVPSMLNQFLNYLENNPNQVEKLKTLRYVFASGEALPAALSAKFQHLIADRHNTQLHNLYGPTEAAVDVTWRPCTPHNNQLTEIPIGRPVYNTKIHILDDNAGLMPPGIDGEIFIGGVQLAEGYVNRPELTAERFVNIRGERLYKTGDKGRINTDGTVSYLGRLDGQIKVRGFRIETGEVENALNKITGVKECAVNAVVSGSGVAELAAWVAVDSEISSAVIKESLGGTLPEYMIPSRFFRVESIPLNPNGKADKRALLKQNTLLDFSEVSGDATDTEKTVTEIWKKLLEIPEAGLDVNFFDSGGNSLLLLNLHEELNALWKGVFRVADLFTHTTIREISSEIDSKNIKKTAADVSKDPKELGRRALKGDREAILLLKEMGYLKTGDSKTYQAPLGQAALWAWEQFNPESSVYHIPVAFQIPYKSSLSDVQQAMEKLADRQQILKASVINKGSKTLLKIDNKLNINIDRAEMKSETDFYKLLERMFISRFDLGSPPLFRVLVADNISEKTKRLVIIFHHIIIDGWSVDIFIREFLEILESGSDKNLPKLKVQYHDYAADYNKLLDSPKAEKLKKFWKNYTSDYKKMDITYDFPRANKLKSSKGAIIQYTASEKVSEAVNRLIKNQNTAFAVFTAALNILYGSLYRSDTVTVSVPSHGRYSEDYYPLIGYFVNMLPIITKIDGSKTVEKFIQETSADIFSVLEHQAYPHTYISDLVKEKANDSNAGFLDIVVNIAEEVDEISALVDIRKVNLGSRFDLSYYITHNFEGLWKVGIEYNSGIYSEKTINRFCEKLFSILCEMAEKYTEPVSGVSVVLDDEIRRLKGLNPEPSDFDETDIIAKFDNTVCKFPDRTAVKLLPEQLTYSELQKQTVEIAAFLRNVMNLNPGETVCVACDRIFEIPAVYLGILRSGCVFLPADPDWPDLRLEYIVRDTGCRVVLSNRTGKKIAGADVVDIRQAYSKEPFRQPEISPLSPAYIIYTSGSAGEPKGVQVSRRSLSYLADISGSAGLNPQGSYLQGAPAVFDASLMNIFVPLLNGGCYTPLTIDSMADAEGFRKTAVKNSCTDMVTSYGIFKSLAEDAGDIFESIKRVMAGGEIMNPALVRRLASKYPELIIINGYGPTESTVICACHILDNARSYDTVPVGRPLQGARIYIADENRKLLPEGVWGELCVAGELLADGYLNRDKLTGEMFAPLPDAGEERVYFTGDIARWNRNGELEIKGRRDSQVKIRGVRIEIGEVEHCLLKIPSVKDCAVVKAAYKEGGSELVAFVCVSKETTEQNVKNALALHIPASHVPSRVIFLDTIPLSSSGKTDRGGLEKTAEALLKSNKKISEINLRSDIHEQIFSILKDILPEKEFDMDSNFFDICGNSLLIVDLFNRINVIYPDRIKIPDLFRYTTVNEICSFITGTQPEETVSEKVQSSDDIAVIGMSVRLSDYDDTDSLWTDLLYGCDRVGEIPPERRKQSLDIMDSDGEGVSFYEMAYLHDISLFDPQRFGISPAEAVLMDSEQKLFMMLCMSALDDAGCGGDYLKSRKVGVFAGVSPSDTYRNFAIRKYPERIEQAFSVTVPSSTATRLSYLMDWKGSAAVVDTACSSSLNAVHLACSAIRNGECEYAFAGGVKVAYAPADHGLDFAIQSKKGRAYVFDDDADGTGMGEGGCAVLLKPLSKAIADGDSIHAVIKGSAVNQDGRSSGPAAPNPKAQTELILSAWADAGVSAETIGYIEAHGTGTKLGDPIEIDAITKAFSRQTEKRQFAAIGSVKGNFGHLDSAAGILGLIKAILCVKHGKIPPQPFFTRPNREIDFENSPVFVPDRVISFPGVYPIRRSGVSSFGLSGVNAHVVIEQAPETVCCEDRNSSCFLLSAPDDEPLRDYCGRLALALAEKDYPLADVAYTLSAGRPVLKKRIAVAAGSKQNLIKALTAVSAGVEYDNGADIFRDNDDIKGDFDVIIADFIKNGKFPKDINGKRVHIPYSRFKAVSVWPQKTEPVKQDKTGHILSAPVETPEGFSFSLDAGRSDFWPIHEHKLSGTPVMVGMAAVPLFKFAAELAGLGGNIKIENLKWLSPLRPDELASPKCLLKLENNGQGWKASIRSKLKGGEWSVVLIGDMVLSEPAERYADISLWKKVCTEDIDLSSLKDSPLLEVSDKWTSLKKQRSDAKREMHYGELETTGKNLGIWKRYNPALIDGAVSIGIRENYVPAFCRSIEVIKPFPEKVFTYVKNRFDEKSRILYTDAVIADEKGEVCLRFDELGFVRKSSMNVPLYRKMWKKRPVSPKPLTELPEMLIACGDETTLNRFREELADAQAYVPEGGAIDGSLVDHINASEGARLIYFQKSDDALFEFVAEMRTLLSSIRKPVYLLSVTNRAWRINNELFNSSTKSSVYGGIVKAAGHESALLKCSSTDCDSETGFNDLLAEFNDFIPGDLPMHPSAFRNGERFVRGFERAAESEGPELVKQDGTYLITGGSGGVGSAFAVYMAEKGAKHIGILSRNPKEISGVINKKQTELHYIKCDVCDKQELDEAVRIFAEKTGGIDGVVHAAGVAGANFLIKKDNEAFRSVLRPKIDATVNIYEAVRRFSPEYMLLCSSTTSLTGAPGQTDYTAANIFQDFFADSRADDRMHILSINWPMWIDTGMAAGLPKEMRSSYGLTPQTGPAVAEAALKTGESGIVPVSDPDILEWLTGDIKDKNSAEKKKTADKKDAPAIIDLITRIWCSELDYKKLDIDEDFYEIGGDSLSAMRIASRLTSETGQTVNVTDIFSNPTIKELTLFLGGEVSETEKKKGIPKAPELDSYEITSGQEDIFRYQQISPDSISFNLPYIARFNDKIDEERLKNSLTVLFERHRIFKASFAESGGGIKMFINDKRTMPFEVFHAESRDEIIETAGELTRPFNLHTDTLFRAAVIKCPENNDILFLDIHHIIADGNTFEILIDELKSIYFGEDLPEEFTDTIDFIHWMKSVERSDVWQQEKEFWLSKFPDGIKELQLPEDMHRPARLTFRGGINYFALEKDMLSRIRDYAKRSKTTVYTFMTTALAMLLTRQAGREDMVIFSASSLRDKPELLKVPGLLINTIPLCIQTEPSKSIAENIKNVGAAIGDSLRYKLYSSGDIKKELGCSYSEDRFRFGEVMFSYMNYAQSGASSGEQPWLEQLGSGMKSSAKAEISIFGLETEDKLHISFEYYADAYSEKYIQRLGGLYRNLIDALLETNPEKPASEISELSQEEHEKLLKVFSGSFTDFPSERSLADLFTETAEKYPDKTAVEQDGRKLTYDELNRTANYAAGILHGLGVKKGDAVAVYADRSIDAVAAVLGIVKAGCCYMPVDVSAPYERADTIIKSAGCSIVISEEDFAGDGFKNILLSDIVSGSAEDVPASQTDGTSAAYIMFTSGTTGLPKGSVIKHQSVSRLVLNTDYIEFTPEDSILMGGTLAFDASTLEIWGALLNGGTLHIANRDRLLSRTGLKDMISDCGITKMWLTSSLFNAEADKDPSVFASLQVLMTGGEKLSTGHVRKVKEACPGLILINGYGPTENTTFTTTHVITDDDIEKSSIPIGRPVANTTVYILDSSRRPVPVGVWGEIAAGGYGVAEGYINDDELTEKVFIDNPFDEGKLYLTGDIGRFREDGIIEIAGRKDAQVKIRGNRVELTEVEAAVTGSGYAGRAAAFIEETDADKILSVCVADFNEENLGSLKTYLRNKIPTYMIPSRYYLVDEIPVNQNGKTDRAALSGCASEGRLLKQTSENSDKTDSRVKMVIDCFRNVMEIDDIGPDDNFFSLGGHSLQAARIIAGIQDDCGYELSIGEFMLNPVIKDIAALIKDTANTSEIPKAEPAEDYPLSFAQRRLYSVCQLEGASNAYNINSITKIDSSLDVDIYRKSAQILVDNNEIFRTCFIEKDGDIRQKIVENVQVPFKIQHLSADDEGNIKNIISEELAQPFDLGSAPLIRFSLWEHTDGSWTIIIIIHHIAGDGTSLEIFFQELTKIYETLASGGEYICEEQEISYKDFSVWQNQFDFTEELETWKYKLRNVPESVELPRDFAVPAERKFTGMTIHREFDTGLAEKLHAVSISLNITFNSMMMAIFALLINKLSGQDDFCIALGAAARHHHSIQKTMGFFVNLLPIRFRFDTEMDVQEYFVNTYSEIIAALDLQHCPFDLIVNEVLTSRVSGRQPLTNIGFEYEAFEMDNSEKSSLGFLEIKNDLGSVIFQDSSKFDATLYVVENKFGVFLKLEFDKELFSENSAEKWLDYYVEFCENIADMLYEKEK